MQRITTRDKNPLTRITLNEIINHEWVTMDGFYPITGRPCRIPFSRIVGKPVADNSISPMYASSSLTRSFRSLEAQCSLTTSQRLQYILKTSAARENSFSRSHSNSAVDLPSFDADVSDRDSVTRSGFLDTPALSKQPSTPSNSPSSTQDSTQPPLKAAQAQASLNADRLTESTFVIDEFQDNNRPSSPFLRSSSPPPHSGMYDDEERSFDPRLPPLPPRFIDTTCSKHRAASLYSEAIPDDNPPHSTSSFNRSASCSFSTTSSLTPAFRHVEADASGTFTNSPRVVVGRGVVSEGYDSNHLGSQYPSLLRQTSSDQAPENLMRTHHVKKLQNAKWA